MCHAFGGTIMLFQKSNSQGENLSPILFSLLLNDLEDYKSSNGCSGLEFNMNDNQINSYLKLMVLLYADNTVIFGTDPENFQNNLNIFFEYTQQWKLNINHNQFLRNISKLRKGTPVFMLYAELGRVPIEMHVNFK